ncbi:type VII secretion integral membrane protein EccD [Mycobacteroides abscessus 5S-0422]|uniref:Type VII secretion integral membrane protein EccD n=1 Tax=Mycobacteroides abscessus subsp. bolletii 1513 TaxID=1299321 RepID=X8DTH1_9MYCO|nr:type VII secretion integral membrane protein EccD [Mycobacteroides abscessus]EUA71033.1 type VII secretion integral membrane protein EccD [Mycobacteroides abscessus subsp. bolletii 1513]EIU14576.1 type VII secretion integral membrane protein EccD [Mycobacteroides abscessus 5S-0304]EIU15571.1 type VII secretion integral membrane protein EccD [Mycobacteroides abscessus 5S-0421]EIU16467.1 type VII secretion integral membrane protein EccD [Mycobacteroides abscessus 5S-0422]EIU28473.1 type VII s
MSDNAVMPIVRVAVLGEEKLTEVALPTQLPMRDIIPAVHRIVAPDATEATTPQRLSLAPVNGAPFSADATLDTVGVVDGDLLTLRPTPAGPAAPGIVEDIADAAVIFSESRKRPWGAEHIARVGRFGVLGLIAAATILAIVHSIRTGSSLSLAGLAVVAVAAAIGALVAHVRSARLGAELAVTALVPIAGALALAVPGSGLAPRVLLGAAGVAAWSLIYLIVARQLIAFFTATTVLSLGIAGAAGAHVLWHPSLLVVGCGLIIVALLVTVRAAQLSAFAARFPLPTIPAPGDATPSAPAMSVLKDLPRRVQLSDSHQSGFIAGASILAILGSLAVVGGAAPASPWAWYLVAAVSAGAALRARVWDSAVCKAWLLAVPFLVSTALLVIFAVEERYTGALVALGVLALLVAAVAVVVFNPKIGEAESYSLPSRRLLGFLASGIDASLLPVIAYLTGLFSWILNR